MPDITMVQTETETETILFDRFVGEGSQSCHTISYITNAGEHKGNVNSL